MSRHQFHVATLFLPIVGFLGRDAKIQVATSHTVTHVATSKMMLRPQIQLAKSQPQIFRSQLQKAIPRRDLKFMSRHQIHNVLLRRQNPRSPSLRPTATQPGRDATSWLGRHAQPNQVATSNRCRDLNRS